MRGKAAKVVRVSNRALKVYIYTLDNVLVKEFTSKIEALSVRGPAGISKIYLISIYLSPFFSYPYFFFLSNINDPSSEATTSLEWSLSSPPPFHAYSTLPVQS
jgi:hypothetical protein